MSRSPVGQVADPQQEYLNAWQQLAKRIQLGQSFSGRERNCAFLNVGDARFADVSSAIGLDQIDDSRAVALSDWDQDGDLDLWLTNRTGPRVRFLRNDLQNNHHWIAFRLVGNPQLRCPADAIGARLELTTQDSQGVEHSRIQTLYAGDGFLSQSSKWIHFGVSDGTMPVQLSVRWPGSDVPEVFDELVVDHRYRIVQGKRTAEPVADRTPVVKLPARDLTEAVSSTATRVYLSYPRPTTSMMFDRFEGDRVSVEAVAEGPLLLTLWASWCGPCIAELQDFSKHWQQIDAAGANVLALNIESLEDERNDVDQARQIARQLSPRFPMGIATHDLVQQLNELRHRVVYREDPLPLPVSFLLDGQRRVRVIYSGRVDVDRVIADVADLSDKKVALRDRAVPFSGRWSDELFVTNPIAIAKIYRDERQYDDAIEYLQRFLENHPAPEKGDTSNEARKRRRQLADVHHLLGRVAIDQRRPTDALKWLSSALDFHPGHFDALVDSADVLMRGGQNQVASELLTRANRIFSDDPNVHNKLGLALMNINQVNQAIDHFERALKLDAVYLPAANNLAWLLSTHPNPDYRDGRRAVELAERIAKSTGARPDVADTLAAAYAEVGDFEAATDWARQAIQQARGINNLEFARRIEQRLKLYESGQPFRDAANEQTSVE